MFCYDKCQKISCFFLSSLFLSFNISLAQLVSVSKDLISACEESASRFDGDGWGWENSKSCRVGRLGKCIPCPRKSNL